MPPNPWIWKLGCEGGGVGEWRGAASAADDPRDRWGGTRWGDGGLRIVFIPGGAGGWTPGSDHSTEMEALALVQLLFSGGAARF